MQMRTLTPFLVIALLGSTLCGQTGVVSPAFAAKREGRNGPAVFGDYPSWRYQMFEGDFRNKPFAIKEVRFRLHSMEGAGIAAAGRSWTNVSVFMAPCNYASVSRTFASNYTREVSLSEALQLDSISVYGKQATGEKFLINPNK